jgi:hypothetical protein
MSLVEPLVDRGVLPGPDSFLITPGNHDVSRGIPNPAGRFAGFTTSQAPFPTRVFPDTIPRQSVISEAYR